MAGVPAASAGPAESRDALAFYSKSRAVPAGRGAQERVAKGRAYALPPNFRQVLSNFARTPLVFDGKTYETVEHAFHAEKLRQAGYPAAAAKFEPRHEDYVGADPAAAKKAGGKRGLVKLTPSQIAAWSGSWADVMHRLWAAKFTPPGAPRDVLLATGDAELWHLLGRGGKERWFALEELRGRLG